MTTRAALLVASYPHRGKRSSRFAGCPRHFIHGGGFYFRAGGETDKNNGRVTAIGGYLKYPADEKQFEATANEYFRRAGCWAHHMATSIPGFPDSQYMNDASGGFFIEYKFIRESVLNRKMAWLFESDQPAQIVSMIQHGARVYVAAFHIWAIYAQRLTVESVLALCDITALEWLDAVDSWEWDNVRGFTKAIVNAEI